jgi:flagellar biosynthesis anti-sigma factor FlgM
MKVNDLSHVGRVQIGTEGAHATKSGGAKGPGVAQESTDVDTSGLTVSISREARALASENKAFDATRVERLRQASCEGSLSCDARHIASRLIEEG